MKEVWQDSDGQRYVRKNKGQKGFSIAAVAAALLGNFHNADVASTPGGIERQEAEGQRSFVESETPLLPLEIQYPDTRKDFEDMGIKFGKNSDDLFCEVKLPEGWKIESTDHSMWNRLIDDQGRERAEIFFKAAFYDRTAFMRVVK